MEVRRAARAIVEDPAYRASLAARVIAGIAPHMEPVLFYYAYGKPTKDVNEVAAENVAALQSMSKAERIGWLKDLLQRMEAEEEQPALTDGAVVDAEVVK
jgi:hypothetical protein